MTATTRRCSGSSATWSQQSPLRASAGSSGSQCFSFLATNAHSSSNWTSRVRGGNGDQLVVEVAGLRAGQAAQAADRAAVHLAEPAGLADAAPLGDVLRHRLGLPGREPGVEQRRAPALGGAGLAGAAAEHAAGLLGAVAAGHRQIPGPPPAMVGALGIQATEAGEVVHGAAPPMRSSRLMLRCVTP